MNTFVLEAKICRDTLQHARVLTISEQIFLADFSCIYLPNTWLTFRPLCLSPLVLHGRNAPLHSPLPSYLLFILQCCSPGSSFCLIHNIINYSFLCVFIAFCISHFTIVILCLTLPIKLKSLRFGVIVNSSL